MLLLLERDPQLAQTVAGPLQSHVFEVGPATGDLATPEFAAAEITNLFHHAAETVWRLLICINDTTGVRLALARLSPDGLRRRLHAFLDMTDADRARDVRTNLNVKQRHDAADDHMAATARLLRIAAVHLLDHAPLYNATKHGFAVAAEHSMIGFSENADGSSPRPSREGLWLRHVETVQRDDRQCWTVTHTAVDVDQMTTFTYLLIALLETTWNVGRALAEDRDDVTLLLPSGEQMRQLLDRPRMEITRLRRDLQYTGRDSLITMEFEILDRARPEAPAADMPT